MRGLKSSHRAGGMSRHLRWWGVLVGWGRSKKCKGLPWGREEAAFSGSKNSEWCLESCE